MRWQDIVDGEWSIPRETRAKGNAGKVKLPALALDVLQSLDRVSGSPFVFPASRGEYSFEAFSQLKSDLDRLLPEGMPSWVFHDLRRTARTRMAKIGVPDKIAELTLGHKIVGIEAVYNHNDYLTPKSVALDRLAAHISDVLSGATNVIALRSA
jgi:integrase